MENDSLNQWREYLKKIEPLLDRMIQAGWANNYVHDKDVFFVDWTELGHKRMKYLSAAFYEMFPTPSARGEYADFWDLVTIYGHFHPGVASGSGQAE